MSSSEDLIDTVIQAANSLFPLAQASFVYRASIAYILQHIKSFLTAIESLKNKELTPLEKQALQRFDGLVSHFANVLPHLGQKWINAALTWSSIHMHNYIDSFRIKLNEICEQLGINPQQVIKYDQAQDSVNKYADLQHLKNALRGVREKSISITNSVDVQQLIETRLRSIQRHLPRKSNRMQAAPSSDAIPIIELQRRMDKELSVFNSIDIPCEDLRLDDPLGCGGFGTVFKGTRLSTAELLAVKEVRSDKLTMSTWASLYSEVATMAPLRHRYVLELVGAHIKEPYRIITRFCPGKSLFDRLHRTVDSQLSPQKLTAIAYQVAEGMRFLHANGIVHRDLKTMNILLDDIESAKIADFGLAGMMKDNNQLVGGVGTPHYTAPEVLERKRYGPKVDTYSYGVILWEMASRQIPFRDKTHQDIYEHVVTRGWRLPLNPSIPDGMKKLITRCWSSNPNDRPEFAEIVEMFDEGKLFFNGCEKVSRDMLETPECCPPLDIDYLLTVLKDPDHDQFSSVVSFLAEHIDDRISQTLKDEGIISSYTAQSSNADSILVLASVILDDTNFQEFIESVASPILEIIFELPKLESLKSGLVFCLKVPTKNLNLIDQYLASFVERISDFQELGPYVIQLLARHNEKTIEQFQSELIQFFDNDGAITITDQKSIDAVNVILPIIGKRMNQNQFDKFIILLNKDLNIPIPLISLLIKKTSSDCTVQLIMSIIQAAYHSDITDSLVQLLQNCTKNHMKEIATYYEVFDHINRLLVERRSLKAALLLLFRLAIVPSVPPILANHSILHSLLNIEDHVAQRLQIFTALFANEQFCSDTTISESILKLIVSSLSVESLSDFSLKLIAALSTHQTGIRLITQTGMLSLFSQMFLSSSYGDDATTLTILSNVANEGSEIPQASLIISCLMQDLIYSVTNKIDILNTLIHMIRTSPTSVQEHDLQNSILPLISPRQQPVLIVLALQLLDACDMSKLRGFYNQIIQRVFNILTLDSMMYPELLSAAIDLIASLSTEYDITQFIDQTDLIEFINSILPQIEPFEEIHQKMSNCVYMLANAKGPVDEMELEEPRSSTKLARMPSQ